MTPEVSDADDRRAEGFASHSDATGSLTIVNFRLSNETRRGMTLQSTIGSRQSAMNNALTR